MAGITWLHDGWAKLPYGSQAQRDKLSDHIKEVTEAQARGSYTVEGKTHSLELSAQIRELYRQQAALNAQPVAPSVDSVDAGEQTYFMQGRAPMP